MAAETHVYAPKKRFAGSSPEAITAPGTVLSGENLPDLQVVASDAAGKFIAHPGFSSESVLLNPTGNTTIDTTVPVAGLLNGAVDASGGDLPGIVYKSGVFFADQITWPASANTNALKLKLLEGSMFHVEFQDVGEV